MADTVIRANVVLDFNTSNIGAEATKIKAALSRNPIEIPVILQINQASIQQITTSLPQFQRLAGILNSISANAQTASVNIGLLGKALQGAGAQTTATQAVATSINNATVATRNLNTATQAVGASTQKATGHVQRFDEAIGLSAKRFATFAIAAGVISTVVFQFSAAVKAAVDFDFQMVRFKQVGHDAAYVIKDLSNEIGHLAKTIGVSSKDLSEAAVTLRQAGFAAKDTQKILKLLAETSVAPTFESIQQTTEGVIAIFNQFGGSIDDLSHKFSVINRIAADYAVESADIIDAARRSGAAFVAAGADFEQFVALFSSVRQTTRESAESIATGLRTIFARLERGSTIGRLRNIGIELEEFPGKVKAPLEAVKELYKVIGNEPAGSTKLAAIVEEVGGIRQFEKVIPLIQKLPLAVEMYNKAQQKTNSLSEDQKTALESVSNKLTRLKESFLELFRTIGSDNTFKTLLELMIKMAQTAVDLAAKLEPILPVLVAAGAIRFGGAIKGAAAGIARGFRNPIHAKEGGKVEETFSGLSGRDRTPILAEPGEFVFSKEASQKLGYATLENANEKLKGGGFQAPKYAQGGPVFGFARGMFAQGGVVFGMAKGGFATGGLVNSLRQNRYKGYAGGGITGDDLTEEERKAFTEEDLEKLKKKYQAAENLKNPKVTREEIELGKAEVLRARDIAVKEGKVKKGPTQRELRQTARQLAEKARNQKEIAEARQRLFGKTGLPGSLGEEFTPSTEVQRNLGEIKRTQTDRAATERGIEAHQQAQAIEAEAQRQNALKYRAVQKPQYGPPESIYGPSRPPPLRTELLRRKNQLRTTQQIINKEIEYPRQEPVITPPGLEPIITPAGGFIGQAKDPEAIAAATNPSVTPRVHEGLTEALRRTRGTTAPQNIPSFPIGQGAGLPAPLFNTAPIFKPQLGTGQFAQPGSIHDLAVRHQMFAAQQARIAAQSQTVNVNRGVGREEFKQALAGTPYQSKNYGGRVFVNTVPDMESIKSYATQYGQRGKGLNLQVPQSSLGTEGVGAALYSDYRTLPELNPKNITGYQTINPNSPIGKEKNFQALQARYQRYTNYLQNKSEVSKKIPRVAYDERGMDAQEAEIYNKRLQTPTGPPLPPRPPINVASAAAGGNFPPEPFGTFSANVGATGPGGFGNLYNRNLGRPNRPPALEAIRAQQLVEAARNRRAGRTNLGQSQIFAGITGGAPTITAQAGIPNQIPPGREIQRYVPPGGPIQLHGTAIPLGPPPFKASEGFVNNTTTIPGPYPPFPKGPGFFNRAAQGFGNFFGQNIGGPAPGGPGSNVSGPPTAGAGGFFPRNFPTFNAKIGRFGPAAGKLALGAAAIGAYTVPGLLEQQFGTAQNPGNFGVGGARAAAAVGGGLTGALTGGATAAFLTGNNPLGIAAGILAGAFSGVSESIKHFDAELDKVNLGKFSDLISKITAKDINFQTGQVGKPFRQEFTNRLGEILKPHLPSEEGFFKRNLGEGIGAGLQNTADFLNAPLIKPESPAGAIEEGLTEPIRTPLKDFFQDFNTQKGIGKQAQTFQNLPENVKGEVSQNAVHLLQELFKAQGGKGTISELSRQFGSVEALGQKTNLLTLAGLDPKAFDDFVRFTKGFQVAADIQTKLTAATAQSATELEDFTDKLEKFGQKLEQASETFFTTGNIAKNLSAPLLEGKIGGPVFTPGLKGLGLGEFEEFGKPGGGLDQVEETIRDLLKKQVTFGGGPTKTLLGAGVGAALGGNPLGVAGINLGGAAKSIEVSNTAGELTGEQKELQGIDIAQAFKGTAAGKGFRGKQIGARLQNIVTQQGLNVKTLAENKGELGFAKLATGPEREQVEIAKKQGEIANKALEEGAQRRINEENIRFQLSQQRAQQAGVEGEQGVEAITRREQIAPFPTFGVPIGPTRQNTVRDRIIDAAIAKQGKGLTPVEIGVLRSTRNRPRNRVETGEEFVNRTDIEQIRKETGQGAFSAKDIAIQRRGRERETTFNKQQEAILAGTDLKGKDITNVNKLQGGIKTQGILAAKLQSQIIDLKEQPLAQGETPGARQKKLGDLGNALVDAQSKIIKFKTVLDNVANSTHALQTAQENFANALEKRDADLSARKDIAKLATFGSPQDQQQFLFKEQLTRQAIAGGAKNFQNLPPEIRAIVGEHLEATQGFGRAFEEPGQLRRTKRDAAGRTHLVRDTNPFTLTGKEIEAALIQPALDALAGPNALDQSLTGFDRHGRPRGVARNARGQELGPAGILQHNLNDEELRVKAANAAKNAARNAGVALQENQVGQLGILNDASMQKFIKDLNSTVQEQAKTLLAFAADTAELVRALDSFDGKLTIKRDGKIQVILNGGELLKAERRDTDKYIIDEIKRQLNPQNLQQQMNNIVP